MNTRLLLLFGSLGAFPVTAEIYVAPFGGYSFGASEFDISTSVSDESGKGKLAESEHYGLMLGITTKDPGNVYLLYSHQATDLRAGDNFSPDVLTSMDVDYFHVGGSLYFPNKSIKPYVTTSVGLTHMRPGGGYANETRFSMAIGGGIAYQASQSLALFAEVKGYATFINADNALFCDAGGCLWNIQADIMWQGQANIGASFAF